MFACATYRLTEEFEDNISHEIEENVRRIRHHACLALWCGNNEMEGMIYDGYGETPLLRGDYTRMYSYVIPKIVKREDPDAFYWPSSPSSGGDFDNPHDETRGDAHYWQVWHGYRPFTNYRRHNFRYASEFGFESLPAMKTIESFTEERDRTVFSYVMEKASEKRKRLCEDDGLSGTVSSVSQGSCPSGLCVPRSCRGRRCGTESSTGGRHRGQCMGAIVWQLNDCWPVASWSSIDYFGRWKALHYFEKRFFAPVMLSCCEEGLLSQNPNPNARFYDVEKSIRLHVANETTEEQKVLVRWSLRDSSSGGDWRREDGRSDGFLRLTVCGWKRRNFRMRITWNIMFFMSVCKNGVVISEGSVLFSMPKFYNYQDPKLTVHREGEELVVYAEAYAAFVELQNENEDLILSDNYFDMEAGRETHTDP